MPDEQGAFGLPDKLAGRQLVDLFFRDFGIIAPIKVLQGLHFREACHAAAVGDPALLADVELVLEEERQELGMGESAGGGLLQADIESGRQAGEPELFQGGCELRVVHVGKGMR